MGLEERETCEKGGEEKDEKWRRRWRRCGKRCGGGPWRQRIEGDASDKTNGDRDDHVSFLIATKIGSIRIRTSI
jgi:hypothetical protein